MPTIRRRRAPASADHITARELVLYIENDGTLYRQMYRPIVQNYAKKVVKRKYNRQLAVKGVVNLVNEGIRRYRKEFGLSQVSAATKHAAAKTILSGMIGEIRDAVRDIRAGRK